MTANHKLPGQAKMKRRIPTAEEMEESRRIVRLGRLRYALVPPGALHIGTVLFYFLLGKFTARYEAVIETDRLVGCLIACSIANLLMWSAHRQRLQVFAPCKCRPSSIAQAGSNHSHGA